MELKDKMLSAKAKAGNDELKWKASFMAFLSQALVDTGARPPVIIGGTAVELFTFGQYASDDIDLKSDRGITFKILAQLGFEPVGMHLWESKELDILIDWQGESFEQGDGEIRKRVLQIRTSDGPVTLLPIEELIVDRLCAAKFWKHESSGEWAKYLYEIAVEHEIHMDNEFMAKRLKEEDVSDFFEKFVMQKKQPG